jgi:hypothetical protein
MPALSSQIPRNGWGLMFSATFDQQPSRSSRVPHRRAESADRLGLFALSSLRRLLVRATPFYFAKGSLALHLFLQNAQRSIAVRGRGQL